MCFPVEKMLNADKDTRNVHFVSAHPRRDQLCFSEQKNNFALAWDRISNFESPALKRYIFVQCDNYILFLTTSPRLKLMWACAGGTFSPSRTMKWLDPLIRRGVRQMLPLGLSEKIDCRTARPPISASKYIWICSSLYCIISILYHIVSPRICIQPEASRPYRIHAYLDISKIKFFVSYFWPALTWIWRIGISTQKSVRH